MTDSECIGYFHTNDRFDEDFTLRSGMLVLGSALQVSEPDFNGAARDFTPPVGWIFLQDFYDFRILDVQFSDLEYPIFNFDLCHGFLSFFRIIGIAVGFRYCRITLCGSDL